MPKAPGPKITHLKSTTINEYSDGDDVENYLLDLFENGLSDSARNDILHDNPEWAIKYHLSYDRNTLLGWYPFEKGSKILEVGSGCGSITESLVANKDIMVISNELSPRRADINAARNKNANNLELVVGNLYDYSPSEKFDYVVCVGVFEYAGTFIESSNPYKSFLESMAGFLKPGGTLLLAIENQLGFKYFAGAAEDHTGILFDGINDYPSKKAVRTFGKNDLEDRLMKAGYSNTYFYYPYPDYKLPTTIFSDDYHPGKDGVLFPKALLPTPNPDQPRDLLFSEQSFVSIIERNGLFPYFSNSFLVEAVLNEK